MFSKVLILTCFGFACASLFFDDEPTPTTPTPMKPFNPIIDLSYQGSEDVHRKMNMLTDVTSSVHQLFEKTKNRGGSGSIEKEVLGQLRSRMMEKITSLRFMLESVDRIVSERNQMERISEIFNGLAHRRVNESDYLVKQIHRTASEIGDTIKLDMTRIVGVLDGGLFGFGSLSGLLDRIDLSPFMSFKL